jgi:hypothetical protein
VVLQGAMHQFEVLQAGVEGPCLHRPRNWLVKQLNDWPRPVYLVGFIREKRKATVRVCSGAQKPVARCSGESWGFYGCFSSGLGDFFYHWLWICGLF